MVLILRASHFKDTEFRSTRLSSPIENVYRQQTGHLCVESVCQLRDKTRKTTYFHQEYVISRYQTDKEKAKSLNWNDTIIAEIELIKEYER